MLEMGNPVSIEITKGYKDENFHEFIKELFTNSGVKGKKQTFIFLDTQILYESFLEDINNILNSGEVPNLWPQDEKDVVLNDMRPIA